MRATLHVTEPTPGIKVVKLDCPHGETTITAGGPWPDTVLVQAAVARHVAEEGCGCADSIAARASGAEAN